jgi:catechol 2,3-dioxygenase
MILTGNLQMAEPTSNDIVASAPIRIGGVVLVVRDLERTSRFYRDVVGLELIGRDGHALYLGVDSRVLLSLRHDPDALANSAQSAGLYHIAFLLPSRKRSRRLGASRASVWNPIGRCIGSCHQ